MTMHGGCDLELRVMKQYMWNLLIVILFFMCDVMELNIYKNRRNTLT